MKKTVVFALILTMLVALLSGCSSNKTDNATEPNQGQSQEQTKDPGDDANVGSGEKIVINYVNWNLGTEADNNIERKMIAAFEEAHPNIDIQLDESFDYSKYGDSLAAAAAAGKLPDVMMLPNIPFGLTNEWLLNLNDIAASDPEWANIPKALENATHYGSGIYAVPAGMFFQGYFINQDLFEQANLPELNYSPTWDEFLNAVKTLNKPSEDVLGLSEAVQIPDWYPASVNSQLGWFTWDGQQYHLNDPVFIEGVNKAKEIMQGKYTFDSLSEDEKAKYNATWHGDVWNQGKVAVRWEGTWATKDFSNLNFKSKFIGIPGGKFILIGDFIGISKSTEHQQEAYEFAKYMTFGKDGILKRMELNTDGSYTSLPMTTDPSILDQYFANGGYEGLKEAYDNIDNAILEGVKFIPGVVRSRWEAPTGVKVGDKENANLGDLILDSIKGGTKIEDYAEQINKLANDEYKAAADAISALTQ
ncbi:carbohydrate ABC transporter substrate-binding protein, CUT1 family [Paenibacillus sp. cl141a]|uniref:ABC transporter substrate-binding protein n=1 Tax=Paenibacillus sp. cl141a TaxID=1761877 RepID=UPI0008D88390|nr:extracellular solute-binding protein [Paenibacillus sp. cl141a]SEM51669.1 carbohydrate ABC transporter substrate-binding protein, CUT1 family [Paenibacillus sp. cl141a]